MQYEFNLPCGAQYEFELVAAPDDRASDDASTTLPPAKPDDVIPAPASRRVG
jgi:hypothetical protein